MASSSRSVCNLLGIEFSSKDAFLNIVKKLTPETMTHQVVCDIFFLMTQEVKKMDIIWLDIKCALASGFGQDLSHLSIAHLYLVFKEGHASKFTILKIFG